MPQVPSVPENQVALQPLTRARFDAPDIGLGGRIIGQSMQRAGASLREVAQNVDDIHAIYDEANAKKADAEYTSYVRERMFGDGGFYTLEGEDAISARRTVEEDLAKKRGELLAATKSQRERSMLETVLTRRGSEEADSIARHTLTQVKAYADQQGAARISNATDDYATYYAAGDTQRAGEARATVLNELAAEAQRHGWRGDIIENRRNELLTALHTSVIETEMARDPAKAQAYLDEHRDEIDAKAELVLGNRLEPLLVGADATSIADMAEGEFTTSVGEAVAPDAPVGAEPRAVRVANYSARPTPGAPRLKGFPRSYRDPAYDTLDGKYEAKYGLPEGLLSAIRLHGERSNANQVSTAGARGVYQFIPSTRRGFIANYGIDPWRSADEQAEAAAIHLRDDYRKYGSWMKAVAAYNGGKRGVTNPVAETRNYVARVERGLAERGTSVASAPTARAVAQGDLQSQMDWAESYIRDKYAAEGPRQVQLRIDATKTELRQRHAERQAAANQAEAAQWEAVEESVASMGGWDAITSTKQIAGFDDLPGSRKNQVLNVVDANLKEAASARGSDKIETDWSEYARYKAMTPAQLKEVDVDTLRANLGNTEFKEIIGHRNGKADEGTPVTYKSILNVTDSLLTTAGMGLTGVEGKQRDIVVARRGNFLGDLSRWANNYHRAKGQWPDDKAIQDKADLLLLEGVWNGEDGQVVGRMFEAPTVNGNVRSDVKIIVPTNIANRIRQQVPGASNAEVRRLYVEGKKRGAW